MIIMQTIRRKMAAALVVGCLALAFQSALAGGISGCVTAAGGGTPLEGIEVYACNWNGSYWDWTAYSYTDSSGNYLIDSLLLPGTYRVSFYDYSGRYIGETYAGFQGIWPYEGGTDIVVDGDGATATGIDAVLELGSAIEGRVTAADGGMPLENINVQAYRWNGSWWAWSSSAYTDSSGNYQVGGLRAGTYRVRFWDYSVRYIGETYAGFQGIWPDEGGTDIDVAGDGATATGIDAVLEPESAIEGRVTAADGGMPLEEIYVEAYRWNGSRWSWTSSDFTDSSGDYRIGGLLAGTYRLRFSDYGTGQYIGETYAGFQGIWPDEGGTDIDISAGVTVSGSDATLEAYASIAGTVFAAGGGYPVAGVRVHIHGTPISAVTDSEGNYTIHGVIPGTYDLHANPDASTGLLGAWHGGALYTEQRTPPEGSAMVTASSGEAVTHVDFALEQGARIAGIVHGGDRPLASTRITAFNAEFETVYRTTSDTQGHYTLIALLPGTYLLKAEAVGFGDQWWPGVNHQSQAVPFPLEMGDEVVRDFGLFAGQSPALVQVTSDPPGAEIYLDCHPTGQVTPAVIDVGEIGSWDAQGNRLASHVITLKRTGVPQPVPRAIVPVETETTLEHFDLTDEASGSVMIATEPAGAEVFVDYADEPFGVTPLLVENLAPGSHTILLRKEGYLRPRPVTVQIREQAGYIVFRAVDNTQTTVEVPLAPEGSDGAIAVAVESPSVPDMTILVDYLPTAQVTDAVVGWLDPASHAGGFGGSSWHSASHTILLRKQGIRPFAPRLLEGGTSTLQTLIVQPWMTDLSSLSLAEALDTEGTTNPPVWTTGPIGTPWSTVAQVDGNGEDAAVSGPIGQAASSWLRMSVTNSGTLTFNWRVSCQPRYDFLLLTIDGAVKGRLSGESGWASKTVEFLDGGVHEIVWNYMKDSSVTGGQDRAWVDQVVWTPAALLTLEQALDTTNLVWQTEGDSPWHPVIAPTADGEDAARSGPVGDYGISTLTTTVTGPGSLQFYWMVSGEPCGDWLDFLIDGELAGTLTGEMWWMNFSIEIGPGSHTLTWEYWKNESGAVGGDAGFVDQVLWNPSGTPATHTTTTPVPVPFDWLDCYPSLLAAAGGNYEAAAWALTGKRAGSGTALSVWHDFVSGTCPTNLESRFQCMIELDAGRPVLRWEPDLGDERIYTIWGRPTLSDSSWITPTNAASRFYRIEVALP